MTDTKISALTAYTTPIDTDLMPIVDVTNTLTKKILLRDLRNVLGVSQSKYIGPQASNADGVVIAAMAALVAGTIFLGAGDFIPTSGSKVPVPAGITILGVSPTFQNSGNNAVFDAGRVYKSGTRWLGDGLGTTDGFVGNDVDATYTSATPAAFGNSELDNIHISGIFFQGLRYAMKFGAMNQSGLYGSTVTNVWEQDCTQGFDFENFTHCVFDQIYCNDTINNTGPGGIQLKASCPAGACVISGNSTISNIEVLTRKRIHKGFRVVSLIDTEMGGPAGDHAQINTLFGYRMESFRFGETAFSQNVTFNGTSSLTVADGTQFFVDYPVTFSQTNGPFFGTPYLREYFVTSVVGNVIQVSDMMGGIPIVATTSATVTNGIKTGGYPAFSWYAHSPTPSAVAGGIVNSQFNALDMEGGGGAGTGCGAVVQGVNGFRVQFDAVAGAFENHIAVVQGSFVTVEADQNNFATSFKEFATKYVGQQRGPINWNPGWGSWNGHHLGGGAITGTLGATAQVGTGATIALGFGVSSNLTCNMTKGFVRIITGTKGTITSCTTDAIGYAIGSTSIGIAAAGSGAISAGDYISFVGDNTQYLVKTGVANVTVGGTVVLLSGLIKAIAAAATGIKAALTPGTLATLTSTLAKSMWLTDVHPVNSAANSVKANVYSNTTGTNSFAMVADTAGLLESTQYDFGYNAP